jgi:hypothetical protein
MLLVSESGASRKKKTEGGKTSYCTFDLGVKGIVLTTIAALIIESPGFVFLWGKDPRIIEISLLLPPTKVEPIGSICSNATVYTCPKNIVLGCIESRKRIRAQKPFPSSCPTAFNPKECDRSLGTDQISGARLLHNIQPEICGCTCTSREVPCFWAADRRKIGPTGNSRK